MKKYFLLIIMVIYTADYIFSDNILSKFQQNDYKLKDVRIQLVNFDKNYLNIFEIKTFKYNRSITAHNITVRFKEDVGDQLEILVQMYKFLSNEYRRYAVRFQVNLQKAFEANIVGLTHARKCGNFTNCIFRKDVTYHICNFVVDETRFPPLIPNGRYRNEIMFLYLNRQIAAVDLFGEVYRPMVYPKK